MVLYIYVCQTYLFILYIVKMFVYLKNTYPWFKTENYNILINIICFGFKKTNREISTTGGEIMNLFFQKFILQTTLIYINWYKLLNIH